MPNWCNNTVEIGHSDPTKIKELVTAVNEGKFLNYCKPVPEALQIVAGRVGDDNDPKQIELQKQTMNNLSVYGYATWYDFCVNEWGTKWDVDAIETIELEGDVDHVTFGFDSAWSPPTGAMEYLMDQGFTVKLYYYEPGMAFAGVWDNGDDDYYELGGMSSKEAQANLPPELDEMFGISECIAEYEAEEEQEEENENE
jgi:hypothetical protein